MASERQTTMDVMRKLAVAAACAVATAGGAILFDCESRTVVGWALLVFGLLATSCGSEQELSGDETTE